jgi:hypothetical protein
MDWHRLLRTIIVVAILSSPLVAQDDSTCTWDRCALRVHRNFFGARLVRGIDGEKVAGLGVFPGALPLLAERSDSAAIHYDAFRSKQTGGSAALFVGLAAFLVGNVVAYNDSESAGGAIAVGGLAVSLIGGAVVISGQNELQKAIWWYNRTFVPPGR